MKKTVITILAVLAFAGTAFANAAPIGEAAVRATLAHRDLLGQPLSAFEKRFGHAPACLRKGNQVVCGDEHVAFYATTKGGRIAGFGASVSTENQYQVCHGFFLELHERLGTPDLIEPGYFVWVKPKISVVFDDHAEDADPCQFTIVRTR